MSFPLPLHSARPVRKEEALKPLDQDVADASAGMGMGWN